MVKVLDNPVVALDILPGTKAQKDAITCSKYANSFLCIIDTKFPSGHNKVDGNRQKTDEDNEDAQSSDEDEQGALAHAQYAATALSSTLSGTAKGLVDVTGDTVVGVFGIVAGVGKGLGSVAAHGGSAVGKAVGVGGLRRDSQVRDLSRGEVGKTEQEERR
jgi:hypothetical protein